jgi:hypothetical protein
MNVGYGRVIVDPPRPISISMKVKASVGNYTYEGEWYAAPQGSRWDFPGTYGNIPPDCTGGTMQLFLSAPGTDEVSIYVDEAHFNETYNPPTPGPITPYIKTIKISPTGVIGGILDSVQLPANAEAPVYLNYRSTK